MNYKACKTNRCSSPASSSPHSICSQPLRSCLSSWRSKLWQSWTESFHPTSPCLVHISSFLGALCLSLSLFHIGWRCCDIHLKERQRGVFWTHFIFFDLSWIFFFILTLHLLCCPDLPWRFKHPCLLPVWYKEAVVVCEAALILHARASLTVFVQQLSDDIHRLLSCICSLKSKPGEWQGSKTALTVWTDKG